MSRKLKLKTVIWWSKWQTFLSVTSLCCWCDLIMTSSWHHTSHFLAHRKHEDCMKHKHQTYIRLTVVTLTLDVGSPAGLTWGAASTPLHCLSVWHNLSVQQVNLHHAAGSPVWWHQSWDRKYDLWSLHSDIFSHTNAEKMSKIHIQSSDPSEV